MTLDEEAGCYFHRQPETSEEISHAIDALAVSCMEIHRYGGTDDTIRDRLTRAGLGRLCDHPSEQYLLGERLAHLRVQRDRLRLRFLLPGPRLAADVARSLSRALQTRFPDGNATDADDADHHRADFAWSFGAGGTQVRYAVERVVTREYPFFASQPCWCVTVPEADESRLLIHELVSQIGGVDLHWLSLDEWRAHAPGQPTPF